MIETIKKNIDKHHSLQDHRGIFLSYFDKEGELIGSHGVLKTDKNLGVVVDMLYHAILKPHQQHIKTLVCDIVKSTKILHSLEDIKNVDIHQEGLSISSLDRSKSGVMLPHTSGINSVAHMIQSIKEKNNISGDTIIHSFTTTRLSLSF